MKRHLILLSVMVLLLLPACRTHVEPELPYSRQLRDVLGQARQSTHIMGVSAAIIVPGYQPWLGVSGESYPDHPISEDMLFDTASAGKVLMAALVMDLAEDGLLSLDDPIRQYLPPYPNVDGSITIRQLLNHTNGLYDMVSHPDGPFRKPYRQIEFDKWWTMDEIFTRLGGAPYLAPGEGFHYTQAGYQLAAQIVEKVTRSTVSAEIQKRLLDPQDLDGMLLDFSKPIPGRFSIAHPWIDADGDGVFEDEFSKSRNWIASLSRILFYSRAEDFAVWMNALFAGKVLQPNSLQEMMTFVHPKPEETGGPLFVDYGLGLMEINPHLMRGQRVLGHLGSIPGYRTFLGHFTDSGVTMVIMYNSDTDEGFPIIDGLLGVVLDHLEQDSSGRQMSR